jgi:hypothetical protein
MAPQFNALARVEETVGVVIVFLKHSVWAVLYPVIIMVEPIVYNLF